MPSSSMWLWQKSLVCYFTESNFVVSVSPGAVNCERKDNLDTAVSLKEWQLVDKQGPILQVALLERALVRKELRQGKELYKNA